MIEPIRKLTGLPPIYVVSIEESKSRRQNLYSQFEKFSIKDFTFLIYKRFSEYDWKLTGDHVDKIYVHSYGPTTSHILANKFWTENTDHEYALIIEDDIDLSFIKLWNFNWLDLFNSLPEDWTCLQLCQMREQPWTMNFSLRRRRHVDFGAQIYLIKRSRAEKMVDHYWRDYGFHLTIPPCNVLHDNGDEEWCELFPIVENLLFQGGGFGTTYNLPLFAEDLANTETTTPDGYYGKFRYDCKDMIAQKITSYSF